MLMSTSGFGYCHYKRHRPPCGHSTCWSLQQGTEHNLLGLNAQANPHNRFWFCRVRPASSPTIINSNVQTLSGGAARITTPDHCLPILVTSEWKRVQPFLKRLVSEPLLCFKVRPTIFDRNSTLHTSSDSFPIREETFRNPRGGDLMATRCLPSCPSRPGPGETWLCKT